MKVKQADWYKSIWSLGIKEMSWVEETEAQVGFIIKQLGLTGKERILDLACGFGRHSLCFAQQGYDVTGVDITEAYVKDAQEAAKKIGVAATFICSDLRELSYCNEFDVVLNMADGAIGYFENDAENAKTFDIIAKALKPGGKSFIDVCNAAYAAYYFPKKHWEAGAKALSLADFDWDAQNKRMLYGSYSYKYGEPVNYPEYEAVSFRLYTKEEINDILEARDMVIRNTFADVGGTKDSRRHMQLMVFSQKKG